MEKTFYITTSIPYVNAPPHLGNILDSLYADVLVRYKRAQGHDARFLVGTDEHGAKIVRTAKLAGVTPRELVSKNSDRYRKLREVLELSWDDFIRTSDENRHWPGAKKMWQLLDKSGDLYKKKYKGLYCIGHEAFITDKDLQDGKCKDHQKEPELIEEENWFFQLSKYTKKIETKIKSNELRIVPESRKNEILGLLKEGLEDVSFSRPSKDLAWGVPIPGDSSQTMYVWADALTSYISALGFGTNDESLFKKYWPADVQVVGKDNLRFHAAIWIGMLLSVGLPLPSTLFVHGFITVEGQKMSKTVGNILDPFSLVAEYKTEPLRYYLLREISPYDDGDFSKVKFRERYNADLSNGLGNFAARVLALAVRIGDLKVQIKTDIEKSVALKIKNTKQAIEQKMDAFKFHEALATLWELITFGDGYVNETRPWQTNDQKAIFNALVILDNVAGCLASFLPETSEKIKGSIQWISATTLRALPLPILFPRIQ